MLTHWSYCSLALSHRYGKVNFTTIGSDDGFVARHEQAVMVYCQLHQKENISIWNFICNPDAFIQENGYDKIIYKLRPSCPGLNVLNNYTNYTIGTVHIVLGMWSEAGVCLKSISRWKNVQNIYFYLIYVSWTNRIFLSKYGRKKLRQKTIATIATSTTYLMMPWSLTSVAHEQLWYWPLTMNRPLPSTRTELRWKEYMHFFSWWRHQMETFPALLALCAGN